MELVLIKDIYRNEVFVHYYFNVNRCDLNVSCRMSTVTFVCEYITLILPYFVIIHFDIKVTFCDMYTINSFILMEINLKIPHRNLGDIIKCTGIFI